MVNYLTKFTAAGISNEYSFELTFIMALQFVRQLTLWTIQYYAALFWL